MLRDWTDSEAIDQLTAGAERFFTRLIMKVDDHGCYPANPQLLKSSLFPLKDDVTREMCEDWLAECRAAGVVTTYQSGGKGYLNVTNFNQRLRQKNLKYPLPDSCQTDDGQMTDTCLTDDGLNRREEKRNRIEVQLEEKKAFEAIGDTSLPFVVIQAKYLNELPIKLHGPAAVAKYIFDKSEIVVAEATARKLFGTRAGAFFKDYNHLYNTIKKLES